MAENRLPGHLSQRAGRAIRPALSYFKAFMEAKSRQWSPEDPEGENRAPGRLTGLHAPDALANVTRAAQATLFSLLRRTASAATSCGWVAGCGKGAGRLRGVSLGGGEAYWVRRVR